MVLHRTDLKPARIVRFVITRAQQPPKAIGDLIDEVERIREELFVLQQELEKLETIQKLVDSDESKAE
jgi:hypothetical protein